MAFTTEQRAKAAATRAANSQARAHSAAVTEKEVTARNFPQARPIRARATRQEATRGERRRRRNGNLDRMAQFKLDIFQPEQIDPDYIYRWVSDEGSRLRMVTRMDDYDYVNASEIEGFNAEAETDSEGGERVRMIVGEKKSGAAVYSYLLKKPRWMWEEDNRIGQDFRDDRLTGRVYKGEAEDIAARVVGKDGEIEAVGPAQADTSTFYVPEGAQLNHGLAERRRGPVQAGA